MLVFTKGQTAQMVVTLNEKKTLSSPYYLMVFRNTTTEEIVTIIVNSTSDTSLYPDRFNRFPVVVNTHFNNKPDGTWWYTIYEQASSSNTNPALALTQLEQGYMKLKPATAYTVTEATTDNTYKVYEGS